MIKTIYKKEMLELIRDKKTLVFMILLPLLIFPAIFGSLAFFAAKTIKQEQTRQLSYIVIGADDNNSIISALANQADFIQYPTQVELSREHWQPLLQTRQLDFVLEVDANFVQNMQDNQQSEWILHFYNADGMNSTINRVQQFINQFNQGLTDEKLLKFNLTETQIQGVIKPIQLTKRDTAQEKESLGSQLGGLVAYILLPLCLLGAMYPAIDMGAGEKERGTLESLLIAPVGRGQLVLGKFLTIFTASFTAALMAVVSLAFWSFIFAQGLAIEIIVKIVGTLGVGDLLLALFMLCPVVMLVSALVLTISIYAKNFKEAQNFMGPLSLFIFLPLIVAMLPGIKLNWMWALVPISNVALAIKEILKGHADLTMLGLIWGSQFILACLMLGFCMFWFSREKVLFRC